MQKLSVVIITKNEEKNIERCLRSVAWADELFILDSGSTDGTLEICRRFGCRIVETPWLGFGPTKHLAVDSARFDWILSVDADEEVSTELRDTVREILDGEPEYPVYRIRRQSYYLEKLIRHSGWNHDYPLRLFDRRKGNFNDKESHESVEVAGLKGSIEAPLIHYPYPTLQSHVDKMNLYAELVARGKFQQGKSSSPGYAILAGITKFLKMYILQAGFLDGRHGLMLALNSAYGVYLKYVKLWQLKR